MNRAKILIGGAIIILLSTAGVWLWFRGFIGGDPKLLRSIQNKPELVAIFKKAIADEREMVKNPDEAARYINAGLQWKSVAELSSVNQPAFFRRSLSIYEKGIERFGQKNILFYLNAGKVAERVGEFGKAERYYKKAIEISSGDESGYLYLVDLYYYQLHKGPKEILPIFDQGLKALMNPALLIVGRATYLRRIGDNAAALKDYQELVKIFPQAPGYRQIVQELTQKLKSGEK